MGLPVVSIIMFFFGMSPPDDNKVPRTKSVNVGTVPSQEQQACVGFPTYESKVTREMDRWQAVLTAMFPDVEKYGKFVRVQKNTSWGPEWQLRFRFARSSDTAQAFAEFMLKNLPTKWPGEITELHFVPEIKVQEPPKVDDEDELDLDPFKF